MTSPALSKFTTQGLLPKAALQASLARDGIAVMRRSGLTSPEYASVMTELAFARGQQDYDAGGGSNNRMSVGGSFQSTGTEPPNALILPHSEMVYSRKFPERILFVCFEVPEAGQGVGEYVSTLGVTQTLTPNLRRKFQQHGIRYTRNFTNADNYDPDIYFKHWQESFGTRNKSDVELEFKNPVYRNVDFKWDQRGGLKVTYTLPAFVKHPSLGCTMFLNQAVAMHGSIWDEWDKFNKLPYAERPYEAFFGNGDPITPQEFADLSKVYADNMLTMSWDSVGDVAVLDNLLWMHGRPPYTGPRKLGVMIGDEMSFDELVVD